MKRAAAGFSLAEALVALAVFGMAGVGFLHQTTQSAAAARHLEAGLNARFVAENLIVEALLEAGSPARLETGEAAMGAESFAWERRLDPTTEPELWRVTVSVRAEGGEQVLAALTAFRRAP